MAYLDITKALHFLIFCDYILMKPWQNSDNYIQLLPLSPLKYMDL